MQYFGGKNRTGKEIALFINEYTNNKVFYSLFVGSGGVEQYIKAKEKNYNDLHPALKTMYTALKEGWIPTLNDFYEKYQIDGDKEYYTSFSDWYKKQKSYYKKIKRLTVLI